MGWTKELDKVRLGDDFAEALGVALEVGSVMSLAAGACDYQGTDRMLASSVRFGHQRPAAMRLWSPGLTDRMLDVDCCVNGYSYPR